MPGEDAVVQHEIDPGARSQGRQLLEEFERFEEKMTGAICPSRLEREHDAAVAQELKPVLADGRTNR